MKTMGKFGPRGKMKTMKTMGKCGPHETRQIIYHSNGNYESFQKM